jgi:N-acetylmuramoyl-L-alanine amidase
MPRLWHLAGIVLVCTLVRAPVSGQATTLRIDAGGRSTLVDAAVTPDGLAWPAAALEAMGARLIAFDGGIRAVLFDDTLSFWIGSPFFRVRSTIHPLATPIASGAAGVLLPRQFFTEWLPSAYATRITHSDGVLLVSGDVAFAEPPREPSRRVVVLDPGHGGDDTGKIGPNGLREKDAALQLSRRIATVLERRGYEVHLTRSTDTLVALADRPRLANRWKAGRPAAVFVSIHFNSAASAARTATGFETFFLSEARTEDEKRVADLENAAVEFEDGPSEPMTDELIILNGLLNDFWVRASNDLAEVVQTGIATVHTGPDRGVKRAGFRVLAGALMPAVLVEAAFISNLQEARQIADSAFQERVAAAIADAIHRYFDTHEHLWTGGG